MNELMGVWRRLLVGLMPVGLVLAACSNPAGVSSEANVAAPQGEPATPLDEPVEFLTINVDITDDGIQPPSIFIPAGRRVQLVLRNRGSAEHHFRVPRLVPKDLLWLARPEGAREEGVTDEEHERHHDASFVPFRARSPAGIRPMGDEAHAYAAAGGMDVILFTATNTGTFSVQCPLHPGIVGKVTVF